MLIFLPLLIACKTTTVPKPDETATKLETVELAQDLADQSMATWQPEKLAFGWIESVFAFGLHRLYDTSEATTYHDYYRHWMEDELADFSNNDPKEFNSSDSMSPAILASTAMSEDSSLDFTLVTDAAHAYLEVVPRTSQGAIAHWGQDNFWGNTHQVWVDSQFMFGVFLLKEYERTGKQEHLDLFVEQYLLFSQLCRDEKTQLYRHAYDDEIDENIPTEAVFWARGNSWVLISAAEYLLVTDSPDNQVQSLFVAHAEAIAALQHPEDGLWRTVLNDPISGDPANYTETSASALIAYALVRGMQSNTLDTSLVASVDAAISGLEERIDEDTDAWVLSGTSFGTNPGDYDYYVTVPQMDNLMLGLGAAIMLLAEADGLEIP
ncbi:MAG: hypothetical protein HN348_05195 [Proteobacteria bacterium]|nr:hypothetical protein [Pseudomonadota bacterium]